VRYFITKGKQEIVDISTLRKNGHFYLVLTLDASFCIDVLEEAVYRYGTPDIFNTDQGSQYTSEAFTEVLENHGIKISMDGKGAWKDNVRPLHGYYAVR
jgi:putative transposase